MIRHCLSLQVIDIKFFVVFTFREEPYFGLRKTTVVGLEFSYSIKKNCICKLPCDLETSD
jgi:hypothetical protein